MFSPAQKAHEDNYAIYVKYTNASAVNIPAMGATGYQTVTLTTSNTTDLSQYVCTGVSAISLAGGDSAYLAVSGLNVSGSTKSIRINNYSSSARTLAVGYVEVVIAYIKK